jgi:2,3-bisphosphoglycerate-independent phosphoglycerate mutase
MPESENLIPENKTVKAPTVLVVIDGFGVAPDGDGNAVTRAETPNFDRFVKMYPAMTLRASGEEVGLSWGETGNSELGHLTIGAGRVCYQAFPRIHRAMSSGEFSKNKTFLEAFEHVKKHQSRLHLIGMVSQGRVHSMDEHCHTLLALAKEQGISDVFVQAIMDGHDTVYNAGIDSLTTLQTKIDEAGVGKIASLSGRFYAMDRDHRWDRTEKNYNAMVLGQGEQSENALEALKDSYQKEVYDEEIIPTVITEGGQPVGLVQPNDAIIFFNFRPDRMRQLTKAFVLPDFDGFERTKVENIFPVTMTEYEKGLPVEIAFPPEKIDKCLAQVISEAGLRQLHIAETEKYAQVTFFFNGRREDPFPGEERVMIPSPKVATYDEAPEMSAKLIVDRVLKEMQLSKFDFIVINFANPDMVGHTGDFDATKKAVVTIDEVLGKITEATLIRGGVLVVTADHGNAEELKNLRTGDINKEHVTNPVPLLIIGKQYEWQPSISGEVPEGDLSLVPPIGQLADVAPTLLAIMDIEQPSEMTGQSLI